MTTNPKREEYEVIYWKDVHALKNGWSTVKEATKEAIELFSKKHFTVGMVIYEDKQMIVTAATGEFDGEAPTYNDISMIPKSEVLSRKLL